MFAEHMKRGPWEESPFNNGNFVHHHHNLPVVGVGQTGTCSQQQQQHFIPIHVIEENYNNNHNNNNNHHHHQRMNKHSFPLMEEEMQEPEFEIKEINKLEIPTIFRQVEETGTPPRPTTVRSTPHPVPPPTMQHPNAFMDDHNMSTSPLNSPGYNSSIRHIPIFFEGKPPQHQNNSNINQNNTKSSSTQQQQQQEQQQQKKPQNVIPIPIPLPPVAMNREPEMSQMQKSSPPTPPPRNPHNIHRHTNLNNCDHHNYSTPSSQSCEEIKAPQRKNPASSPPSSVPTTTMTSESKDDSPVPPPIKRPTPPKSPLEKVELISQDVKELEKQVSEFVGSGQKTKEYVFLDEMLTRNLIRLDDINVEGREDIRMARKDCINLIQKCIASLENKISPKNNSIPQNNETMAVALVTPAPVVLLPMSQVVKQNLANIANKIKNSTKNNSTKNLAVPVTMSPTHRSEISIEINKGEQQDSEAKNDESKS